MKANAGWLCAGLLLAGCEARDWLLSPTDKINRAVQVTGELETGQRRLLEETPEAQRGEVREQLAARMRVRATTCAKGYLPAWYVTASSLANRLADRECFAKADRDIARWVGYRRAAAMLALPPLRPLPARPPAALQASDSISMWDFSIAREAGVALYKTNSGYEITEVETAKPLLRLPLTSYGGASSISPNGRVFTFLDGARVSLRASQTGEEIVWIEGARLRGAKILDAKTLYYVREGGGGPTVFVDLPTGREAETKVMANGVLAVPGAENEYIVFSHVRVAKYELQRAAPDLSLKLLVEDPTPMSYTSNTSGLTADGKRFFNSWGPLGVLDLATMKMESVEFGGFFVQTTAATNDPDKLVLSGFNKAVPGSSATYLFSLKDRTVARVDAQAVTTTALTYIAPLRRIGAYRSGTIALLEEIPAAEPIPLSEFTTQMAVASVEAKTAAVAPGARPETIADPIMNAMPANARIEGVGVYEAATQTYTSAGKRRGGPVQVLVRKSDVPLVLVLTSYEPVRWALTMAPGAKVYAILVSSYEHADVVGAGDVQVIEIGNAHAYKPEGREYDLLNKAVMKWTGKPVTRLQGTYRGTGFSVGGT